MSRRPPKVSQRAPKVSRKGAKSEPKGAKREPRGNQNASKNRCSEKVVKMMEKGGTARLHDIPFWESFPSKVDEEIDAKIDVEKVMEIDEMSMRKLIYIFILIEKCFPGKTYFS